MGAVKRPSILGPINVCDCVCARAAMNGCWRRDQAEMVNSLSLCVTVAQEKTVEDKADKFRRELAQKLEDKRKQLEETAKEKREQDGESKTQTLNDATSASSIVVDRPP